MDEIIFTIDPAAYLYDDETTDATATANTNADVIASVVSPTANTGSSSSNSSSSTTTTTTTTENNNSCQLCASNNKLYQLNERRVVLHQSVYTTCEAMADELNHNSDMEDEICIDSQRSLFADCCDVGTSIPLPTPPATTTNGGGGDGLATSESNDAGNSTTTTISKDDDDDNSTTTTSASSIEPDQNTWWCGISWDHVTSNCDSAVPCPGGDAVDCPAGQACFASTPCTRSPTYRPSVNPSGVPSAVPSSSPTRTPWGVETFVDFIYGDRDDTTATTTTTNNGGTNNYNSDVTLTDGGFVNSNSNDDDDDDDDDTDLKNVTSFSVDELKYHFFCGKSWTEADVTCDVHCPSGDKSDCPMGHDCYANT